MPGGNRLSGREAGGAENGRYVVNRALSFLCAARWGTTEHRAVTLQRGAPPRRPRQRRTEAARRGSREACSWCSTDQDFSPLPILVESTRLKWRESFTKRVPDMKHGFESRHAAKVDQRALFATALLPNHPVLRRSKTDGVSPRCRDLRALHRRGPPWKCSGNYSSSAGPRFESLTAHQHKRELPEHRNCPLILDQQCTSDGPAPPGLA